MSLSPLWRRRPSIGSLQSHRPMKKISTSGFVISGSPHDVFADTDLDLQACSLCQKLDDMKKKKVLGICFDQQVSSDLDLIELDSLGFIIYILKYTS
ncbi:hypothetical protein Bca4012_000604 [Brassica carinata]